MMKETLSSTALLDLPLFAFILFMAVFVFVVLRVFLKRRNDPLMTSLAAMPLEDDEGTATTTNAQGASR